MGGMYGFGTVVPRRRGLSRGLGAAAVRAHARRAARRHHGGPLARGDRVDAARPSTSHASYYERWMYGLERRLERRRLDRAGRGGRRDRRACRAKPRARAERPGARPRASVAVAAQRRCPEPLPRLRASRPASACACAACARRVTRAARATCAARTASIERVHGDDLLPDAAARGEDEPVEAGLRGALPTPTISSGPSEEPPLPRARRPLGVLPRGARLMHDHDHDHGHDHGHHDAAGLASRSCVRAPSRRCSSSAGWSRPTRSTPSSSTTRTTSARRTAPA